MQDSRFCNSTIFIVLIIETKMEHEHLRRTRCTCRLRYDWKIFNYSGVINALQPILILNSNLQAEYVQLINSNLYLINNILALEYYLFI